jgi:hypothetical protein
MISLEKKILFSTCISGVATGTIFWHLPKLSLRKAFEKE